MRRSINEIVEMLKPICSPDISDEQLCTVVDALGGEVLESEVIAKDIFDPHHDLLTGDEYICSECCRGTRDEWYEYMLNRTDWYNDYLQCARKNNETESTIEEWANDQVDDHTSSWEGDLEYRPLN